MTLTNSVREAIRAVLDDGQRHTNEDFRAELAARGVEIPPGSAIIRATVYQMKNKGEIVALAPGTFQKRSPDPCVQETGEQTLSAEELRVTCRRLERTIEELEHFNWIKCSDADLRNAREKAVILQKMRDTLKRFGV